MDERAFKTFDNFIKSIKHSNRFFLDNGIRTDLIKAIHYSGSTLSAGYTLYRARINEKDQKEPYTKEELSTPPAYKIRNGRANPAGIPYLYTSTTEATCIAEVRPFLRDIVTVAEFRLLKAIKIIDFDTAKSLQDNPYLDYLALRLAATFSASVHPSRADIDYVPFQYISELIKHEGYAGIQYRSCMNKEPNVYNIVLFDKNLVDYIGQKIYEVYNVSVDSWEVDPFTKS